MTKEENSLLLYLETRAVDHAGRVDTLHMNDEDMGIASSWNAVGFILFGRIASAYLKTPKQVKYGTHWCRFSEEARQAACTERQARAERMWKARAWRTTEEKQK